MKRVFAMCFVLAVAGCAQQEEPGGLSGDINAPYINGKGGALSGPREERPKWLKCPPGTDLHLTGRFRSDVGPDGYCKNDEERENPKAPPPVDCTSLDHDFWKPETMIAVVKTREKNCA